MINTVDTSQLGYATTLNHQRSISGAQISMSSVAGDSGNGSMSMDQVSFSYFKIEESFTYSSTGSIQSASDAAYDRLRGFVLDVFEKQGMDSSFAVGEESIDLQNLSGEQAQGLIADDGYFGVEQTSDRIVDFATGIAGGDPSRLDAILEGVEKGFNEALEAFGGWLPEISHQTYDAVLAKLDAWAGESQA